MVRLASGLTRAYLFMLQVNEGSALTAGALIARLELDDPTKVKRAETFTGKHTEAWLLCMHAHHFAKKRHLPTIVLCC